MSPLKPDEIAIAIATNNIGFLVVAFCEHQKDPMRDTVIAALTARAPMLVDLLWESWDDFDRELTRDRDKRSKWLPTAASLRYDWLSTTAIAVGPPIVGPLLAAVRAHDNAWPTAASEVLQGLPSIADQMSSALADGDATVRFLAAGYFIHNPDASGVDALCAALSDEDARVRSSAAVSLGRIGDQRAIDRLAESLTDEDGEVRASAARSLGKLSATQAVAGLEAQLLRDPSSGARMAAAQALRALQLPETAVSLRQALDDSDSLVREVAVEALGDTGDVGSMEELKRLKKKDPDFHVKLAAGSALKKLKKLRT